ncbi:MULTISPECIES: glycoside hydrolase family 3 C-terminal domain-containing protein [Stenotrophomonas]|uniref:beta-glucosidase family protein n=1 Tax=Stenotrophomonas TaxID=40323 RepID=UPI000A8CE1AA|nr:MULTISPECIES: glycoside hydrolase family 3 C-terminal domain-containing protein [Stenotrophomonas]
MATMQRTHQLAPMVAGIMLALALAATAQAKELPKLGQAPLQQVVAALTVEEKIALVTGQGMVFPGLPDDMQAPVVGAIDDHVPGAAGATVAVPRLGIPSLVLSDGPAGVRINPTRKNAPGKTFHATAFPIGSALASSWDTALVREVGSAIADEAAAYAIDVMLTPAMNIHRYPLGGRNFEYYSEDPVVTGETAAALVQGLQDRGVGASVKHFAVNNHEWNRNTINARVDERALREIYLKGFEIAMHKGQPWTVMSSYNKLNGSYTSESTWLLSDVLRTQWNYQGLVMTDWFGGKDAVAQMRAGNELLMPGTGSQRKVLSAALANGTLDQRVLDRNVTRVLELVLRSRAYKQAPHSDAPDLRGNATISRRAATQGMVLLKNDAATLPLAAASRLAILGHGSYEVITGGTGSGDVNKAYAISLLQGLQNAGFSNAAGLGERYALYIAEQTPKLPTTLWYLPKPRVPERPVEAAELAQLAQQQDLAVVTISRGSGEFVDRKPENDFQLSATERALLQATSTAFHAQGKKVVVVLNIGGVMETASWRDLADAILLAWQPGQEAGNAVADVLSGAVNPSGKLADTFAINLADYPAADGFPGKVLQGPDPNDKSIFGEIARAAEVEYRDSIWVGYRHFDTRKVDVAYPFGFGLSYTDFSYSDLKVDGGTQGPVHASVKITNTGKVAGREVAQVYVSAPSSPLPKPAQELRAFAKTTLLQPGQSQVLQFQIEGRDLASFNPELGRWVADKGRYSLRVGASSRDIRAQQGFDKAEASSYTP